MLRILFIVSVTVVAVIGASIGYFNAQPVHFNYLFGEVQLPLIALLIAVFLFAVLLTLLVMFVRMFGLRSEVRRLKGQVRNAETELKSLRNLPLGPESR
jgi:putative membrane protein